VSPSGAGFRVAKELSARVTAVSLPRGGGGGGRETKRMQSARGGGRAGLVDLDPRHVKDGQAVPEAGG